MIAKAEKVLADALRLPPRARATIAGNLILSLDRNADNDVEAAWAAEIDRRLDSFETSKREAISWDEVKRRIQKARRAQVRT